jgi:aquaporin Z
MFKEYRSYLAEMLGTFILIFCGTGVIIVDQEFNGIITHPGISITVGIVVATMIYGFGDISGAHMNPAVTVGFYLAKEFPAKQIVPYFISQALGAVCASALLRYTFPSNIGLGMTHPGIGIYQALIFEIILAFILMIVILNVAKGSKEKGLFAGIAIGGVIAMEIMFAGPVSGASMNPVRSLAPALIKGQFQGLWIYLVGPFIGVSIAVFFWKILKDKN